MAGDSQATVASIQQRTVGVDGVEKIEIVDRCIVVGVAGAIGMGQRIKAEVRNLWDGRRFARKSSAEAMELIQAELGKHLEVEWRTVKAACDALGLQAAGSLTSTLV